MREDMRKKCRVFVHESVKSSMSCFYRFVEED